MESFPQICQVHFAFEDKEGKAFLTGTPALIGGSCPSVALVANDNRWKIFFKTPFTACEGLRKTGLVIIISSSSFIVFRLFQLPELTDHSLFLLFSSILLALALLLWFSWGSTLPHSQHQQRRICCAIVIDDGSHRQLGQSEPSGTQG